MYEIFHKCSLPKNSIDVYKLYAYSDSVIFFLYAWNAFGALTCYLFLHEIWLSACYNARKILVVCHYYDNIYVFDFNGDEFISPS